MAKPSVADPDLIVSYKFPETTFTYTERDAAIYALGIGACSKDALDKDELKYVYHPDGQHAIKVLPTFAAVFNLDVISDLSYLPGLQYDHRLLLHGQEYIEIYKPLPSSGSVLNKTSISGLHDKGKASVLEYEVLSYEKESGELLSMSLITVYLRGTGGFSKSSHPYSYSKNPLSQNLAAKIPETPPFSVHEERTQPSQALLYRLSGDYNPVHSDPNVAEVAGFSRPIQHGLCSLGFAVRAIIRCVCKGNSDLVKSISCRFLHPVYPGETLITEMWLDGSRVIYQVKVKERSRVVISGVVGIHQLTSSL